MQLRDLKYLLLIISIFISAVIETDIYLPAFPDMMNFFQQSERNIQKLLTWNFMGLCVSGPIYGPLSDAYGRKKPLLVALSLFFAGCVLTLIATNYDWMLVGRVLQGLGSGGCFTLGTAIIFDAFQKEKATDALNKINMIVPFIIASAPMLGGYLNQHYGFRANFWAITISVITCLSLAVFVYQETLQSSQRVALDRKTILQNFRRVLTNAQFLRLTAIISFVFAGFLVFLAMSAVLFVLEFSVPKGRYPFYQSSLLLAYLGASLVCSPLIKRKGVGFVKSLGKISMLGSCFLLLIAGLVTPTHPIVLTACMAPFVCGFIWIQTPYVTEIMELLPDIKGIAASVLTSLRLLITAGIVGSTATAYNATVYPTISIIIGLSLATYWLIRTYEARKAL